jgi:hypothetical protein
MIRRADHAFAWHDFNIRRGWFYGEDEKGFFVSPASTEGTQMLVFRPTEGTFGFHRARLDAYEARPIETSHRGLHSNVKSKKRVYTHGGEKDVLTVSMRITHRGENYRWISQPWSIQWRPHWECNTTTQEIVRILICKGQFYRRESVNKNMNLRQKENGRFVNVAFRPITENDQPRCVKRSSARVEALLEEYWASAYKKREGGQVSAD